MTVNDCHQNVSVNCFIEIIITDLDAIKWSPTIPSITILQPYEYSHILGGQKCSRYGAVSVPTIRSHRDTDMVHIPRMTYPAPVGTTTLHHPQPQLAPTSSGIILPFHIAPTSPPTMAPQTIEPLPQQVIGASGSGTNPYRTGSSHPSLYKQSRNLSPAPPTTNITLQSSASCPLVDPFKRSMRMPAGSDSTGSERPRSTAMQASQATPLPRDSLRHSTSTITTDTAPRQVPSHPQS